MTHANLTLSLASLALFAAACGGPSRPAEDVTSVTMTTSAPVPSNQAPAAPPTGITAAEPPVDSTVRAEPATPSGASVPNADARAPGAPSAGGPVLNDAAILSIADAEGTGERELAREADKSANSPKVRQLAHLILTDHAAGRLAHIEGVKALAPAESSTRARVRSEQSGMAASLHAASGAKFDRVYVDGQVTEMRQFLQVLDDQLIPQSDDLDVRQVLEELRGSTAQHLAIAEQIQSSLRK